MHTFLQFHISDHMLAGIRGYIEHGHRVGGFLSAVIDNDLCQAVGRADDDNIANLPAFVDYFYNYANSECWGSREKRLAWIKHFEDAAEKQEITAMDAVETPSAHEARTEGN